MISLATSMDVERMFSVAGLTVTKHCFNLSDESVCACVVLKDWFKSGLVPIEQVIWISNEKVARKGKSDE